MIDKFMHGFLNRVYGYDDYTQLEINSKLIQKIDEVIDECNNAFEFVEWLKEQGVPDEVQTMMDTMLEDGTLEKLINIEKLNQISSQLTNDIETINEKLTNDIETINSKLDTIKSLNINIGDYEIDNTGNTDVTLKIQKIFDYVRDNGGGKITFPTGEYYIRNYINVYSNTYVFFEDGCIITKKGGLGSQTTFAINRIADGQPYGYTAKNITFDGGVFNGCKLGLGIVVQKVKNLTFKNMKFIDCMIDSHIMDLQGVNNCLVENCIFEGRYPSSPDRLYTECIQYDISSKSGAPSFSGADGKTSYGIIVRNCTFKPNDNDYTSTGFTMFGTHSSWNCYHESIIIENNTVIDTEH